MKQAFLSCYVGERSDLRALVGFACNMLGGASEVEQVSPDQVLVKAAGGCFSIYRVDSGAHALFQLCANLTIFRPERSTDEWLEVRLAREIASSCDAIVYCNPPRDVRRDTDELFQIRLIPVQNQVAAELVLLEDRDANTVVQVGYDPIDLGEHDGFMNPPEYGFPRDQDTPST